MQFFGPPWHTMPLHDHVDWASLGVFINITSDTPWLVVNETAGGLESKESIDFYLLVSNQTAEVASVTVSMPNLRAAYEYLR